MFDRQSLIPESARTHTTDRCEACGCRPMPHNACRNFVGRGRRLPAQCPPKHEGAEGLRPALSLLGMRERPSETVPHGSASATMSLRGRGCGVRPDRGVLAMSSGARGGANRRTTMLGLNQGSASQVWAGLQRHPWSDTTPPETQETCEILGPRRGLFGLCCQNSRRSGLAT